MAVKRRLKHRIQKEESHPYHLRLFHLNEGLPSLPLLRGEIQDMWDVLLGRKESPVSSRRVEALMEVADAYYARAAEITALIQRAELDGTASPTYRKFRTGELRTFMEMARHAADRGSRRVTVKGQQLDAERTGRDSRYTS